MLYGQIKLYHGSPTQDIKELRPGSYVTPDKHIAQIMGKYHLDTGKTWTDDDLVEPYYFKGEPKWKNEPKGVPTIYSLLAKKEDIDFLDNPYEHKTRKSLRLL